MTGVQTDKPVTQRDKTARTKHLLHWAAFLSLFAIIAHGIDAPDHITEWWGYSAYFVTAGAFQFFYGFGLFIQPWRYDDTGGEIVDGERYGRPYYMLGLILTVSIVILYIITRTTGMPFFGPEAGREQLTILSLVPIVVDLPLLYCLGALLYRTRPAKADMREKTKPSVP